MSIDLSKLSSKELFELAKRREQEEQEAAQRVAALNTLCEKRDKLIAEHDAAIATTDKAIRDLEAQRVKQVDDFEVALAPLEAEIIKLERSIQEDEARAQEASATPAAQPARPAVEPSPALAVQAANSTKPAPPAIPKSCAPQANPKSCAPQAASSSNKLDDLYQLIRSMMRNRTYISESLMKEKLKAANYDTSELRKQLDQLANERRIENKGRGNYALGRRK